MFSFLVKHPSGIHPRGGSATTPSTKHGTRRVARSPFDNGRGAGTARAGAGKDRSHVSRLLAVRADGERGHGGRGRRRATLAAAVELPGQAARDRERPKEPGRDSLAGAASRLVCS